jgi:hypothetical protein
MGGIGRGEADELHQPAPYELCQRDARHRGQEDPVERRGAVADFREKALRWHAEPCVADSRQARAHGHATVMATGPRICQFRFEDPADRCPVNMSSEGERQDPARAEREGPVRDPVYRHHF